MVHGDSGGPLGARLGGEWFWTNERSDRLSVARQKHRLRHNARSDAALPGSESSELSSESEEGRACCLQYESGLFEQRDPQRSVFSEPAEF